MMTLSPAQEKAAEKWERDTQNAARLDHTSKRLTASDSIRRARAALAPAEIAILDMVIVKGRHLAVLAQHTGRTEVSLKEQFAAALEKLAQHYEGRAR